jgi:hypothetical protein
MKRSLIISGGLTAALLNATPAHAADPLLV